MNLSGFLIPGFYLSLSVIIDHRDIEILFFNFQLPSQLSSPPNLCHNLSRYLGLPPLVSTMRELIRDSTLGHLLHFISRGRLLGWEEDRDTNTLSRLVSTGDNAGNSSALQHMTVRESHSDATIGNSVRNTETEKGADYELIDWLPNDPANPRNWSVGKKFFVTFEICFLTTSVYIGSAIYTAGLAGVMEQFHVSQTVALLGLTLFVVGYALGPMIWVSGGSARSSRIRPIY